MADFRSVPTKRKFDQLEDQTQFLSNKKIKAEENSHTAGNISFSALPHEIVHFILSFITNDTQRRHIRSVCRLWFDYINYNEFKIGLLLASEVEQFSRCFGRYQKPIGLKFMKLDYLRNLDSWWNSNKTLIRSNQMFHSMLSSLTQLTALDLGLKNFELPPELINLQSLTVISPLNGYTISRLTNLRVLKTCCRYAETPTTVESLDLYNNVEVDIAIDSSYSRLTELIIPTSTRCEIPDALTNLRKLSVFQHQASVNDWLQMISMKFPNLEEFLTSAEREQLPSQYPSTLTKLHVLSYSTVKITEDLTQLKDLQCYGVKLNDKPQLNLLEDCVVQYHNEAILEHLDSQKVTKLQITVMPENINLFNKFTNLIDLNISLDKSPVDELRNLAPLTRLTQLMLIYKSYPQQWMTQLPNLVDLSLQNFDSTPEPINFGSMNQCTSLVLRGRYDSINIINLTNLLQLEISNENALHAVKIHHLSTATNLTSLSVKQKNLRCSFGAIESSELALLTNLRMLCLGRNSIAEMIDFANLTTLQNLTYLEVRALSHTTYHLMRLSRLQKVFLETDNARSLPFCYHF